MRYGIAPSTEGGRDDPDLCRSQTSSGTRAGDAETQRGLCPGGKRSVNNNRKKVSERGRKRLVRKEEKGQ